MSKNRNGVEKDELHTFWITQLSYDTVTQNTDHLCWLYYHYYVKDLFQSIVDFDHEISKCVLKWNVMLIW